MLAGPTGLGIGQHHLKITRLKAYKGLNTRIRDGNSPLFKHPLIYILDKLNQPVHVGLLIIIHR